MTTTTPRLGLIKATTSDAFDTADLVTNADTQDEYPGIFICTSGTQPTWGAAQEGMFIFETDTGLVWVWDGADFQRTWGEGVLNSGARTTAFATASTTGQSVVSTPVTWRGGRSLLIIGEAPQAHNTVGRCMLSLTRGTTVLNEWPIAALDSGAAAPADKAMGSSWVALDTPGAAGAYTYHLRLRSLTGTGGTSEIVAAATTPARISVVEP